MPADKRLVAALIAKPAPGKDEPDADDAGDGLDTAAGEVMDALKNDDKDAFKSALESFVSMCGSSDYGKG